MLTLPSLGMKTVTSNNDLLAFEPSIWFERKKGKAIDKEKGAEKDKFVKFDVPVNRGEGSDENTTEWCIRVFDTGDAEEYCKWRIAFEELAEAMRWTTVEQKFTVLQTILRGEARARFNGGYNSLETQTRGGARRESEKEEQLRQGFHAMTKELFVPTESAWRRQRSYMRYHLTMEKTTVGEFKRRLVEMNKYLKYFPAPRGRNATSALSESELVEIMDRAKPPEYQMDILASNYDPYSKSLQEFTEYLERLETKKTIAKHLNQKAQGEAGTGQLQKKKPEKQQPKGKERHMNGDKCGRCGKPGHHTDNCWHDPKNAEKRLKREKGNYAKKAKHKKGGNEVNFSAEQMSFLMENFKSLKKNPKSKRKRIILSDSESDEEEKHYHARAKNIDLTNSDSDSDYLQPTESSYVIGRKRKKRKEYHNACELIAQMRRSDGRLMPVRVLCDTGTTSTIVLREFVQRMNMRDDAPTLWKTMGGKFVTRKVAVIKFSLPEFSPNRTITWTAHVDDHTDRKRAQYDLIIGNDLLGEIGMDLCFSTGEIKWDTESVPMKNRGLVSDQKAVKLLYHTLVQPPIIMEAEERHRRILDADYSKVNIDEYVANIDHLSPQEKEKLKVVLENHPKLFQGGLGTLKIKPIHLELKEGAVPYHAKPFPIPKAYEQTTRNECDRFEKIGVWYRNSDTEWAAPTFIQPKKTGDVRILTDLRELNKWIVRKPYPLPKIQDMLQKLEQFSYATALDLSMGYYHIPLDKQSQKLCTTILPWGKYSYAKLPMGLSCSPDIFQSIMNELLGDLPYVLVYIDDILILNNKQETAEDHLQKIEQVLSRLEEAGFAVNLRKSFFMQQELEYLGYLLTPLGIRPQPKKVEAISRIMPPKTKRQLRRFLGMVNYYRDMWKRRSHVLAPLTALSSQKSKWKWTDEHQQAFEEAKQMVLRETILNYPDFTKTFHIFTDASAYQLGSVIMQRQKPLAFYTRKMNNAQKRYTVGEQELLSIVETLKEFQNILIGQKIVVHTDHLNLLYKKLASNRLVRWRMIIEEFGPKFKHVDGEKNVVADALSRLEMEARESDEIATEDQPVQLTYMTDIEVMSEDFPMLPALLAKKQKKDKELHKKIQRDKDHHFSTQKVENVELIHYNGKIYVPQTLRERILEWYHDFLVHPGKTRMEATIRNNFSWPGLTPDVETYCKTCHECQVFKKQRKKYGHLPPKQAEIQPWDRVNVDLIGPYTIETPKGKVNLRAMTMIDPATSWFEIAAITDPNSDSCQKAFDSYWLARYPRPREVGFDNGKEFKWLFAELCDNYGIKRKPTTDYNPQSNAILERVHQVLGNALRTFELGKRELPEENPFEEFLTSTAYAIRNTYHTTLNATPGQLVFGRDMLLPMSFKANWAQIALRKQELINKSNKKENKKRLHHEYKVGDKVLLEKGGIQQKMAAPREGPYEITKVSTNGTVCIKKGAITQRVNIRRVTPYF